MSWSSKMRVMTGGHHDEKTPVCAGLSILGNTKEQVLQISQPEGGGFESRNPLQITIPFTQNDCFIIP
jgi:hypothetical protein